MASSFFVVCEGAAFQEDGSCPPPGGAYGTDWIAVTAPDFKSALAAGIAYDEDRPMPDGVTLHDKAHALAFWAR